jgi:hypothetical protein
MRNLHIKFLVLTAVLCGVLAGVCYSQASKFPYPHIFNLEPITKPLVVGPAQLKFTITPFWENETMTITVDVVNGLVYHGENPFSFEGKIEEEREFILDITIPPNDTSSIELDIRGEKIPWNATDLWFVTTGDTVEMYLGKPIGPSLPRTKTGIPDSLLKTDQNPGEKSVKKPTDEEYMRMLEEEPLTGSKIQHIRVNGEIWGRKEGEYQFHKVEVSTDVNQILENKVAPLRDLADNNEFNIVMDLGKSEDYEFVKLLVSELLPMDQGGQIRFELDATFLSRFCG